MKRLRYFLLMGVVLGLTLTTTALAQSRTTLPAATTVPVVGERSEGTLIGYDDTSDRYAPTSIADDSMVYGVVAERPAVVFVTSSTSVPVVTSGMALVKVDDKVEELRVGDVLTSSARAGYAVRASTSDQYAFGFVSALPGDLDSPLVSVVVDPEGARQKLIALRQAAVIDKEVESGWVISTARAIVAALVVLTGLVGIVVGTRVTLGKAITAVGRNPRARGTLFSLAGVAIVSAFALGTLVILVGVGILVLPL